MHDHYLNRFIQRLFFGNSGNAKIFLTILVFLLNLGLVMGIDYTLIHNIPSQQLEHPIIYPDFSAYIDGEILDIHGPSGTFDGYHVLYRDTTGETGLAVLDENSVFRRYHIQRTIPIAEDPYTHDEGNPFAFLRFTIENNTITSLDHNDFQLASGGNRDMSMYIAIAALILLLETIIFNRLHSLFR